MHQKNSQLVTVCHQLRLPAADVKNFLTDIASAEAIVRGNRTVEPVATNIKDRSQLVTDYHQLVIRGVR